MQNFKISSIDTWRGYNSHLSKNKAPCADTKDAYISCMEKVCLQAHINQELEKCNH